MRSMVEGLTTVPSPSTALRAVPLPTAFGRREDQERNSLRQICTSAPAAMIIQTMLSVAEGKARCQRPFTTKPEAPSRFIHWKARERPVSRPVVTSR